MFCALKFMLCYRRAYRQTDKEPARQTDKKADTQSGRHVQRHGSRNTYCPTKTDSKKRREEEGRHRYDKCAYRQADR